MKGIICYYSGSGNTKLAVKYIKKKMSSVDFKLYNIVKNDIPDFSEYDIVGFATFTDFLGVPQYFYTFFNKMSPQLNKPTFVFNTFGNISGKTLKALAELAKSKKFTLGRNDGLKWFLHVVETFQGTPSRSTTFGRF